jgi:aminoglycoside/choline kinase family phosphotransferase
MRSALCDESEEFFTLTEQPVFPQERAEIFFRRETGIAGPYGWEKLHGDGSTRVFFRITSKKHKVILIWCPTGGDFYPNENDSYVYIGRHLLQKGIAVPKILGYLRPEGFILLEDLGSVHLQEAVQTGEQNVHFLYRQAVELLLAIQMTATDDLDLSQCFDTPLYDPSFIIERELKYFYQNFVVGGLGLDMDWRDLEQDFLILAGRAGAGAAGSFFLHRDFQSRNIMVRKGKLHLIDFQGARLGPPQYDLASLLLDPYVQLPAALEDQLLNDYSRQFSERSGVSSQEFLGKYPHVALCRNLQILAAFAFLSRVRGRTHFARYIPPAWERLRLLLTEPACTDYRVLAELVLQQNQQTIGTVAERLEREARAPNGGTKPRR